MLDKKIDKMKEFQAELDRRTQVEEQAMALIAECKFEEANALLNSLDDKAFVQMLDWEENEQCMEREVEETCLITEFAVFVVLILTQVNIVIASKTKKKAKSSILMIKQMLLFLRKEKSCSIGSATA